MGNILRFLIFMPQFDLLTLGSQVFGLFVFLYFLYLITNSNLKGGKGPISIAFEPKDHIHIVLGLNDFRLSAAEANDDKNYHPKEIILHPK